MENFPMNAFRIGSTLSFIILATAVAGCGNDKPATAANDVAQPLPGTDSAATTTTGAATSATTTPNGTMGTTQIAPAQTTTSTTTTPAPATDMNTPLTDEQIAGIINAANSGEVQQAKLAIATTKNSQVEAFAKHMVKAHSEANAKETKLMVSDHLEMADGMLSTKLQQDSSKLMDSLRQKTGTDFDKTYMDAQVNEHQQLLDAIDSKLLPAVKNADLRSYVQAVRGKVTEHLKKAQEIQKSL
jgi:putative membrane protein